MPRNSLTPPTRRPATVPSTVVATGGDCASAAPAVANKASSAPATGWRQKVRFMPVRDPLRWKIDGTIAETTAHGEAMPVAGQGCGLSTVIVRVGRAMVDLAAQAHDPS